MKLLRQLTAGACLLALTIQPRAIILMDSSDPNHNASAPTGNLAGSGWDLQGTWGGFLGTPVYTNFFLAAKHVGGTVGQTFTFRGLNYTTTAKYDHPHSDVDLTLWKVSGSFPDYARLYNRFDIGGKTLVAHGRSGPRGAAANALEACYPNSAGFRGWKHTAYDGVMRWGSANDAFQGASGFFSGSFFLPNAYIYRTVTGASGDFSLANGDSSGGAFVYDQGLWRIAGIGESITGRELRETASGTPFWAAILTTDAGFYDINGNKICPGWAKTAMQWSDVSPDFGWVYSITRSNIIRLERSTVLFDKDFLFVIGGNLGASLTVEASVDLSTWSTIATLSPNGAASVEFKDTSADQYQRRMYRVSSASGVQSHNAVGFERVIVDATASSETKTVFLGYQYLNYVGDILPPTILNTDRAAITYPDGAMVYKWNESSGHYSSTTYEALFGDWYPAKESFDVAEGLMVQAPAGQKIEFPIAGEVKKIGDLTISPGFNLIAYPFPKAVTGNTLGISPINGDQIHKLTDGDGQLGYTVYTYQNNAWSPSVPQIAIGEAFWFNSARTMSFTWSPIHFLW